MAFNQFLANATSVKKKRQKNYSQQNAPIISTTFALPTIFKMATPNTPASKNYIGGKLLTEECNDVYFGEGNRRTKKLITEERNDVYIGKGNRKTKKLMTKECNDSECYICKKDKKTGKLFIAEYCSHIFHSDCLYYNLQNGNANRVCRTCYAKWINKIFDTQSTDPLLIPLIPDNFYGNSNDDEPLSDSEAPSQPQEGQDMAMTVKALPEYPAVIKSDKFDPFAVLVSIRAPMLAPETDDMANTRAPLDLVAVLDVSGSMGVDNKLTLVKQAVNFVIKNLGPKDRLSIITFSNYSTRLTPLKRMTQAGQDDSLKAVDSIRAGGYTNIISGLQTAVKVLDQRREKNPVTSIILLSDGKESENPDFMSCLSRLPISIRSNDVGLGHSPTPIPVYTFGFGSDHDAKALHAISDVSGGTFSYIEAVEVIQDGFAQCLGGLLSVVAQEVEIQVHSGCPQVRIKSIPSGRYKNTIITDSSGSQHGVVYVGDIYADEQKQFLVYVSVPEIKDKYYTPTTMLLEAKCSYKSPLSNEKIESNTARAEIGRPKYALTEKEKQVCLEVDREKNRISIVEGIAEAQELAEKGELDGARSILERRQESVIQSYAGVTGDGPTMSLFRQAGMIVKRMTSKKAYAEGGRAYALSAHNSHMYQRGNYQNYDDFNNGFGFQTIYMEQMGNKSQLKRRDSGQK
ncbi:E3 ubiquitin-protein ligase WAV3-like [Silene latifolia]|uniref:E3 ubiquitin-protein ligase WAV3-like n=1 Tax=Silene latifolia TaxID=37657 RepID=UPI003D787252